MIGWGLFKAEGEGNRVRAGLIHAFTPLNAEVGEAARKPPSIGPSQTPSGEKGGCYRLSELHAPTLHGY